MKKLLLFLLLGASSLQTKAQDSYPTPPDVFQRLFYIQRTGSPNTVVYDAKIGADGQFQKEQVAAEPRDLFPAMPSGIC